VKYDPKLGLNSKSKFDFSGKPYEGGENHVARDREMAKIASRTRPISVDKRLNQMSESELHAEIDMLSQVYETVRDVEDKEKLKEALTKTWEIRESRVSHIDSIDKVNKHIEDVHRALRLRELGAGGESVTAGPTGTARITHELKAETKDDKTVKDRRKDLEERLGNLYSAAQLYQDAGDEESAEKLSTVASDLESILTEKEVISDDLYATRIKNMDQEGISRLMYAKLIEQETKNKKES
jgi:hypothetical protein